MRAALRSFAAASMVRPRSRGGLPHPPIGRALRRLLHPGQASGKTLRGGIGATLAAAALAATVSFVVIVPPTARAAAPDIATDGAPLAVMGLSPSMTARQVLAVLRPQALELSQSIRLCAAAPAAGCTALVRARMPDGWLTIRFADAPTANGPAADASVAWQIRLTISSGNLGPREMRAATTAHYGAPIAPDAQFWCPGIAPGTPCPPDRPRLQLIERPNGTSVLILSDPALRDRPARTPATMRSAGARVRPAAAPAG